MSFSRPPLAAPSVVLLAAFSLVPSAGAARDAHRPDEDVVYEMAPLSSSARHEIIFEMAPLRPVRSASQAPKPVATSAMERALPEPAPIMILSAPRMELAGLREPLAALTGGGVDIQNGSETPGLVPTLDSPAAAEPAQVEDLRTTIADAAPAQSPVESAAPVEARAGTDAAAENDPEARIGAILAEGVAGPAEVRIADRATLSLPGGRVFLPAEAAKKLAKEAGIEWRPGVQGMIAPAGGKLEWLAPVELLADGHIPAGEPDALQPDRLLAVFQASLPQINEQRARVGAAPVTIEGWLVPPALDAKRRLSACVDIAVQNEKGGSEKFFNCEAWALGRAGAIKVSLADAGEMAQRLENEAAALAGAIAYDSGQSFDDFDASTDRAAPYTAADLLTRNVAAQTPNAAPPSQEPAERRTIFDALLLPVLLALAAMGLYILLERRRQSQKGDEEQAEPVVAETTAAADQAPASLFARLLPTLHKRLARKPEQAPDQRTGVKALAASLLDALQSRLAAARGLAKKGDASSAPESASTAEAVEEPASALKKLAARMRRAHEPAAPPPNVARVVRPVRTRSGAAALALAEKTSQPPIVGEEIERTAAGPAPAPELIEPGQKASPVEAVAAEPGKIAPPAAPDVAAGEDDGFALIEPGDLDAAKAAIDLGRKP